MQNILNNNNNNSINVNVNNETTKNKMKIKNLSKKYKKRFLLKCSRSNLNDSNKVLLSERENLIRNKKFNKINRSDSLKKKYSFRPKIFSNKILITNFYRKLKNNEICKDEMTDVILNENQDLSQGEKEIKCDNKLENYENKTESIMSFVASPLTKLEINTNHKKFEEFEDDLGEEEIIDGFAILTFKYFKDLKVNI